MNSSKQNAAKTVVRTDQFTARGKPHQAIELKKLSRLATDQRVVVANSSAPTDTIDSDRGWIDCLQKQWGEIVTASERQPLFQLTRMLSALGNNGFEDVENPGPLI